MKKTSLAIALAATCSANAFVVNIETVPAFGDPTTPFLDNTGQPVAFGTGDLRVGYFSIDDAAISSSADFADLFTNSFVQFSTKSVPIGADFGGGETDGVVANESTSAPITATQNTEFAGQSIFVAVSQNGTFDNSDFIAVFKTSSTFELDGEASEGAATASVGGPLTAENLLIGVNGGAASVAGLDLTSSIQLVAVPEPSTSLLAALAGLGFITRRRR